MFAALIECDFFLLLADVRPEKIRHFLHTIFVFGFEFFVALDRFDTCVVILSDLGIDRLDSIGFVFYIKRSSEILRREENSESDTRQVEGDLADDFFVS